MSCEIYYLRHSILDQELALQLAPFIIASRPHDPIPTKEQLGEPLSQTTELSMKNLCFDVGKEYKPKKKVQA